MNGGDHQPRRGPTAPAGFLTLADTAARFAERLRCSQQKAEYRVAREVTDTERRLSLIEISIMAVLAATEGAQLDFAASEAVLAPREGDIQVIHLHLAGFDGDGDAAQGSGMTMHEPPPRGIPVVVDADDVERLLDELAPRPASVAPAPAVSPYPAPSSPPVATNTPRPPGRPAAYDWAWYEAQARRRVHQHGLPEKSSILVAELMNLFCRKLEDPPEQRTIERFVAKLWPSLEDLSGSCEITPLSSSRRN